MPRKRSSLLRKINAFEFAKRLRRAADDPEKKFAFFLGAGCSITSGISAAGRLVRNSNEPTDWLRQLRDVRSPETNDDGLDDWASRELTHWSPESPAKSYGELIDLLFLHDGDRQREIECICDANAVFPGFGYAILSRLMNWGRDDSDRGGQFNVALTTNFDDLLVDAFFYFQHQRPLVIHHDSLAPFIRPTRVRPMIVKLHGDHQLAPRNRDIETAALNELMRERTSVVLHDRALVFLGYGGADESIIAMLEQLPDESLPFGVYWVSNSEPHGIFRQWLEEREAVWVNHLDFDELMLLIMKEFEFSDPEQSQYRKVHESYLAKKEELLARLENMPDDETGKALQHAVAWAKTWRLAKYDPDTAEKNFESLLGKHPREVGVVGDFASFLTDIRGDHDRAQELYEKAIEVDPNHASILGNFANFMTDIRFDHDRAQELFEKAIKCDPCHPSNLRNFAIFMTDIRGDHDRAEELFESAIEAEPKHANNLRNFANFLTDIRGDHDRAQELFEMAIEIVPVQANILRNFAIFMADIRGDHRRADELNERAIEVDPDQAHLLDGFVSASDCVRDQHDITRDPVDERLLLAEAIPQEPATITHRRQKTKFLQQDKDDDQIVRQQVSKVEIAATVLCRLAYELASESSLRGIARMSLDTLIEHTGSDAGAVLMIPKPQLAKSVGPNDLHILAWRSENRPEYYRLSKFLCGIAIESKEAVLARDVEDDSALCLRDSTGTIHENSVICAPIRLNNRTIGVVHIYSTLKENILDPDELEFALAVAETIGMAMRSRLREQRLATNLSQKKDEIDNLKKMLVGESESVEKIDNQFGAVQKWPANSIGGEELKLADLKFRNRTFNVLKTNNVDCVSRLLELSPKQLLKFHGVGEKTLREIEIALERHGIYLKTSQNDGSDVD